MFDKTIMKNSYRENAIIFSIIGILPVLFMILIYVMTGNTIAMSIFGSGGMSFASMFFNIIELYMIVYLVVVGNKIVANEVDKGTMAVYLTTGKSRKTVVKTKYWFYLSSIFFMMILLYLVGIILLAIEGQYTELILDENGATIGTFEKNTMDLIGKWTFMIFLFTILQFSFAGLIFLAGVYFNRYSISISISGGIALFFYITAYMSSMGQMLGAAGAGMPILDAIGYFTIMRLFDVSKINDFSLVFNIVAIVFYLTIIIGTYFASTIIFVKKDLNL